MKAFCNIGRGRYLCDVVKENPLTTVVKIDPEALISELRSYFMEHGISMRQYREMLSDYGISRKGFSKRHNLKDAVIKVHG